MSKIVIEYDTYFEIKNGLFVDIEDGKDYITKNDIGRTSNREVVFFSSVEAARQFNRAIQEEAYRQSINMSEQELIEHFDRISQQEEEN